MRRRRVDLAHWQARAAKPPRRLHQLPSASRPVETGADLGHQRKHDCSSYGPCLTRAVDMGWQGFACGDCQFLGTAGSEADQRDRRASAELLRAIFGSSLVLDRVVKRRSKGGQAE